MYLVDQSMVCVAKVVKIVALPCEVIMHTFNIDLDDITSLIQSLEPGPLKLLSSDEPPLQILIDEVTNRAFINFWVKIIELFFGALSGVLSPKPGDS